MSTNRIPKYKTGGRIKPKEGAMGVYGRRRPMVTMEMHVINNHLPGLLVKNGTFDVLITKTTRISVAIDSMNQPVWKRAPWA